MTRETTTTNTTTRSPLFGLYELLCDSNKRHDDATVTYANGRDVYDERYDQDYRRHRECSIELLYALDYVATLLMAGV